MDLLSAVNRSVLRKLRRYDRRPPTRSHEDVAVPHSPASISEFSEKIGKRCVQFYFICSACRFQSLFCWLSSRTIVEKCRSFVVEPRCSSRRYRFAQGVNPKLRLRLPVAVSNRITSTLNFES